MKKINAFLLFPLSEFKKNDIYLSNDDLIMDNESLKEYFSDFIQSIDLLHREKNTNVFYDSENIINFLKNTTSDDDELEYLRNFSEIFSDELFKVGAINWRENETEDESSRYYLWDIHSENVSRLISCTLSEVTERKLRNERDEFVLLNLSAFLLERDKLTLFKDNIAIPKFPKFIFIQSVQNKNELKKWLKINRQPRIFRLNPKHGENGKGMKQNKGEVVSPLLGSSDEAQHILNSAIGDTGNSFKLYYWDEKYKHYMMFMDERTEDNIYHGFHVKNKSEIPEQIIKLISEDTSED